MSENVLVVAFDGLDKELIEEFELENIRQEEFGSIDNQTGMKNIYTSELFASFITGTNWEEHGIEGLNKWKDSRGEILDTLVPKNLLETKRGLHRVRETLKSALDAEETKWEKEDLKVDTLFEKIDNSRPIFVPGYNPSTFWTIEADLRPLGFGKTPAETMEHYDTREFSHRKEKLFSELENEFIPARDFLMMHFHRSDTFHHLYGDKDANYDEEKLREMYNEMDELAGEIKEKALEKGYDYIIFMSDHGLPAKIGHNENAFYSSNKELFLDQTPKIMDFHDKVLELVE
ncbi:alkaline phosphatase family protein [Candidatus Nanosalina sp. VS9-1]|uniref:alkaline phosphatase family protein n=1 Tax=Candidatus Nanosalina sp. VS9-1 TaxID=3388566 RepID=UPI0039E0D3B4